MKKILTSVSIFALLMSAPKALAYDAHDEKLDLDPEHSSHHSSSDDSSGDSSHQVFVGGAWTRLVQDHAAQENGGSVQIRGEHKWDASKKNTKEFNWEARGSLTGPAFHHQEHLLGSYLYKFSGEPGEDQGVYFKTRHLIDEDLAKTSLHLAGVGIEMRNNSGTRAYLLGDPLAWQIDSATGVLFYSPNVEAGLEQTIPISGSLRATLQLAGKAAYLAGQDYTVTKISSDGITQTSSDYTTGSGSDLSALARLKVGEDKKWNIYGTFEARRSAFDKNRKVTDDFGFFTGETVPAGKGNHTLSPTFQVGVEVGL